MRDLKVVTITANVGSIFEEPDALMEQWVNEVGSHVCEKDPIILCLHFQEVGGKHVASTLPSIIDKLFSLLEQTGCLKDMTRSSIFLDTDASKGDVHSGFTALGSAYYFHKSITKLSRWSFKNEKFIVFDSTSLVCGSTDPYISKLKFIAGEFGQTRMTRKGFLHARFKINDTVLNFINIHLFHDADNVSAANDEVPSIYARNRREAMRTILAKTGGEESCKNNDGATYDGAPRKRKKTNEPSLNNNRFYFGDMNFRLSLPDVVNYLCSDCRPQRNLKKDQKLYRKRGDQVAHLLLKRKKFQFANPGNMLASPDTWKELKKYDKEISAFDEIEEFPINFPMSYPFSEDKDNGTEYDSTRCPAWCDRILMTKNVKKLIKKETVQYELVGVETCMGDHKPVSLCFEM